MTSKGKNVLGEPLLDCSHDPVTGWHRNGCCETGAGDMGVHTICARMTDEFLQFSRSRGNDLSTPIPDAAFPGLKAGDQWCLCATRWQEAFEAGCAPDVVLAATHIASLEWVNLADLEKHAV